MTDHETIHVPLRVLGYEIANDLPALVGTQRQIDWARLIRYQLLMDVKANMTDATNGQSTEDAQNIHAVAEWLRGKVDVNYWIDRRDCRENAKVLVARVTAEIEGQARMKALAKEEATAILGSVPPEI